MKLGLLLNSYEVPAWFFHSLEKIQQIYEVEFSVILYRDCSGTEEQGSWLKKVWRSRKRLAYQILNWADEKIFLRGRRIASARVDVRSLLAGVPVVLIKSSCDRTSEAISPEDIQSIQKYHLDILISACEQPPCEKIMTVAKYGTWFYEHGQHPLWRGSPPGFWEVVERCPDTGARLFMTDGHTAGARVIYRSRTLTYPFSPARNRNTNLWLSASFLPRQIKLLAQLGDARFFQETVRYNEGFNYYDGRRHVAPTNPESLRFYTRLLARNIAEFYQRQFTRDAWYLMYDFPNNEALAFADFRKMVPPKDRFWADPQIIRKGGKFFIFVEEYLYKNHKGHISVIEMDLQGQCQAAVPVLETNYHLSYPFVFEYENRYYMVPESAQNRSIDLYECVNFPTRWEFKMSLMRDVNAVDTTLFFYAGKWWLFTGLTEHDGAFPEVELFLFSSDELLTTDWHPHPLNPVVSDVTCARPAGPLFIRDGKIFRPSQDCSRNYGYGFNIQEIQCLTETDYIEKTIAAVKPHWDPRLIATHTYTRTEGIQIIDGCTRRNIFV